MFRKLIAFLMIFTLSITPLAWGNSAAASVPDLNRAIAVRPAQLGNGTYPVQQATYNDANGEYNLFLLNATPPMFTTTDLQMARLTDEEIAAGQKSYLQINNSQAVLHLSEEFKIEYVHAVTETQTNPQTGQKETIIVRQESSFWTPFAGAVAGQLVGSMLFAPRYYIPPVYHSGGFLSGYGGYGNTYNQAVNHYQQRYQEPPVAVKNQRSQLRTTGRINSRQTQLNRPAGRNKTGSRPSGSGFGSSRLKSSGQSRPRTLDRGSRGFGSGRPSMGGGMRRTFSGGRRR